MRERSVRVDTDKLIQLSKLYKSVTVAREIGVSKQVWHRYKSAKSDMPESVLDRLCNIYHLDKNAMIVESI